jgi:glutamyl-tRNA reductase
MNLICLGVSHQTASVEVRERLAFPEKHLPEAHRELVGEAGIREVVVLSTCNRVEVYAVADHGGKGFEVLEEYFRRKTGADHEDLPFYRKSDRDGAVHLFRVASGLESMVLGETEIFGQVKKAYALAQGAGTTSRVLNKLFQQSFQVGKHLRNNTQIQRGSTSVGSVAVDLAEKVFGDLRHCHVMLIGAGEMSRVVAQSFFPGEPAVSSSPTGPTSVRWSWRRRSAGRRSGSTTGRPGFPGRTSSSVPPPRRTWSSTRKPSRRR